MLSVVKDLIEFLLSVVVACPGGFPRDRGTTCVELGFEDRSVDFDG